MRFVLSLLSILPLLGQTPVTSISASSETAQSSSSNTAASGDRVLSGSIDFGYRWFSGAGGNLQSYRSIVDLGAGPKLFGWDFALQSSTKTFYDRIDTQGLGWGGDPYTTARLHAKKNAWYDFDIDYRNIAYFNNLPSYADPLLNAQQSYFLNENSFDLRRRVLDVQLRLRPGKRLIPYFDYNRNWNEGRGLTTYVANNTSYPISSQTNDATDSFRGGIRIEMNHWHVTLEQGGVTYGENDSATNSGTNAGNAPSAFNGQQLFLGPLNQSYTISSKAVYSKGLITAHPFTWMDLYGQFLYSQPKSTVNYADSGTGQFLLVFPPNVFFYTGTAFIANTAIKQPHTSGATAAEIRPLKHLRIIESWSTDRLHDASSGPTAQQLISIRTLNLTTPVYSYLIHNSSQQEVYVLYDIGPHLTLRGGDRYIWGDGLVLTPVFVKSPLFESAKSDQQVGLAGATFRFHQKLTANLDFEGGSSSSFYFRTSLYDYRLARVRARYQATTSLWFNAYFSVLNNSNPTLGIGYNYQSRDNSLSVVWSPGGGKHFAFTGDYSRATLHSDLSYIIPSDLSTAVDRYRENDHIATSVIDIVLPSYAGMTPKLSFGGSFFISSGSRPERLYEPLARLSLPIHKGVSWNTEWRWYGFGEQFYLYEGFRAHVLMTGLRLTH